MINTIIAKAKGVLLSPVEAFQQSKTDDPKAVFTYFVVLLLISSILSAIIAALLEERRKNFVPKEPAINTGYLRRYAKQVAPSCRGAVLE